MNGFVAFCALVVLVNVVVFVYRLGYYRGASDEIDRCETVRGIRKVQDC